MSDDLLADSVVDVQLKSELAGAYGLDWMIEQLPGVLASDPFMRRFVRIFQDVADTIRWQSDHLGQLVDPSEAPADVMRWLARWVDLDVDQRNLEPRQREIVANAAPLFRMRGTRAGIEQFLRVATSAPQLRVEESGSVQVHRVPLGRARVEDGPAQPSRTPPFAMEDQVTVRGRLRVIVPAGFFDSSRELPWSRQQLELLIAELVPADVTFEIHERTEADPEYPS